MPFKSEKQRRLMFAEHPETAEKWTKLFGSKPWKKKAAQGDNPEKKPPRKVTR